MIMDVILQQSNEENRRAWEANAAFWDERMGEGNDFANLLCWPIVRSMLDPQPGQRILDAACGNGLFSRRLAGLGAEVVAFDFSAELVKLAQARSSPSTPMPTYHAIDATDGQALRALGAHVFDSVLCNMALFDIADIAPLFQALPELLKPGGRFVFSLAHPAFNNSSVVHLVEERDNNGVIETVHSVKVSRYMSITRSRGLALRGQPEAQVYYDRPLQAYLKHGFDTGFVLDAFEERAFPPGTRQVNPLSWGGNFSEIPPVLVARMRLI